MTPNQYTYLLSKGYDEEAVKRLYNYGASTNNPILFYMNDIDLSDIEMMRLIEENENPAD